MSENPNLEQYTHKVSWLLNHLCNFRCEYCFFDNNFLSREDSSVGKYSPEEIANKFYDTGKIWLIHMSGGEPFMYPKFVELCRQLTKKHYISINSNLSTLNVNDFAEAISPHKVHLINGALHITEREKRRDGVKSYLEKMLHLQLKGFKVNCHYVMYPNLFTRASKDVEFLQKEGVHHVTLKAFRGTYQGLSYPKSYSQLERELLNNFNDNPTELKIVNGYNFFGKACRAGTDSFSMDAAGNVTRCSTSKKKYGNLFEGSFKPDQSPKPCPFADCSCPYEGIRNHIKGKSSTKELVGEIWCELPHLTRLSLSKIKPLKSIYKAYSDTWNVAKTKIKKNKTK